MRLTNSGDWWCFRNDGFFSFAEEYYFRSEYEGKVVAEGWARPSPEGIFETIEIATAEGSLKATPLIYRPTMQPAVGASPTVHSNF